MDLLPASPSDWILSNAMRHVAGLLGPIADRILAAIFAKDLVHVDGTGVKTLHPGEKGYHRGQFAVICNEAGSAYVYSPDKSAKHLLELFGVGKEGGYRGRIVASRGPPPDHPNLQGDRCGPGLRAGAARAGPPSRASGREYDAYGRVLSYIRHPRNGARRRTHTGR
jgi:hypothetical protein